MSESHIAYWMPNVLIYRTFIRFYWVNMIDSLLRAGRSRKFLFDMEWFDPIRRAKQFWLCKIARQWLECRPEHHSHSNIHAESNCGLRVRLAAFIFRLHSRFNFVLITPESQKARCECTTIVVLSHAILFASRLSLLRSASSSLALKMYVRWTERIHFNRHCAREFFTSHNLSSIISCAFWLWSKTAARKRKKFAERNQFRIHVNDSAAARRIKCKFIGGSFNRTSQPDFTRRNSG